MNNNNKKITICGSMVFIEKMIEIKNKLEKKGFEVYYPKISEEKIEYNELSESEQINLKNSFIDEHINKIKKSDIVLVVNYEKNGIKNYIGANSFLEIGFGYILGKKLYLLNDFPKQDNVLEIKAMKPTVINNNLDKIN